MRIPSRVSPFVPAVIIVLAIIAVQGQVQAQPRFSKGDRGMGQERGAKAAGEEEVVRPSGLQPVFSAQMRCPRIASPYGSQTRYDGSFRPTWAFGGYHGGIDISLAEGTPLLALAAGTVVGKGEGGMLEGIYLWLRHSPEDTGLAYWVYSKYQHLESVPDLEVGANVAMGQRVARSGKSGTEGKHYGISGYPHLHLTTRKSSRGDVSVGSREAMRGAPLFDPLAIYHDAWKTMRESAEAPVKDGGIPIPYATTDGKVAPPGTRVVWPVACQLR
jgi:murein DD-endopeptidase MepM/ murein hydrolase activator NlpD